MMKIIRGAIRGGLLLVSGSLNFQNVCFIFSKSITLRMIDTVTSDSKLYRESIKKSSGDEVERNYVMIQLCEDYCPTS